MANTKAFKIEVEMDQYNILSKRKTEMGITLDFQLREAVKMYVELLKRKENENK